MNANPKPQDETVLARLNDPSAQIGVEERGSDPSDPNQTDDDDTVLAHLNGPAEADSSEKRSSRAPNGHVSDVSDESDDGEAPESNGSE
jgi:hypothetical protein